MNTVHKILLILVTTIFLPVVTGGQAVAGQPPQTTVDGDGLVVFCEAGSQIAVQSLDAESIFVTCSDLVTPVPTNTPTAEPPTETPVPPTPTIVPPTATPVPPTPTIVPPTETPAPPTAEPPTDLSSPFGVYPDCIAPAVGLETHSWWHENGETSPRHIHIATCMPNARAVDDGTTFTGDLEAVFRVISFNNPGELRWVRYCWQGSCHDREIVNEQCQASPDEFQECSWYFEFTVDADAANGGLDELRVNPSVDHNVLGTRQYPTLNFQIRTGNGGSYRNSEEPIARAWYSGLSYTRVQWSNYMDLFDGRYDIAVPIVAGTIEIDVRHTKSGGDCVASEGYINPPFHAFHAGGAAEPVPFYSVAGDCFEGVRSLDTTQLSNGLHTIYLQTRVEDERGLNAAAMAYQINVQN